MVTIVSPTEIVPPLPCVIEPFTFKLLLVNVDVNGEKKSKSAKNSSNKAAQMMVGFETDTNHISFFK